MSGKIRFSMLRESCEKDNEDIVYVSVVNAARRAVDEPCPYTRGTIITLLGLDVEIEPIKAVMNLNIGEQADENQRELLSDLSQEALKNGCFYDAIGFSALGGNDPDVFLTSLQFSSHIVDELKKTA